MKTVVVIRQIAHEGPGLIAEVFRDLGLGYTYLDAFSEMPPTIDLSTHLGLVMMGGPMNVDETEKYPFLARELDWIEAALNRRMPVLGICLGSQLLAKALGAAVYPGLAKEIGWCPVQRAGGAAGDPLFRHFNPVETVFQWHGDTFDLPDGAVHLAASEVCPNQAFRFGESAYGLQFHLECTPDMIDQWLGTPVMRDELDAAPGVDAELIRHLTLIESPRMLDLGRHVFGEFANMCIRNRES